MNADFTFIDKTLGHALENKKLSILQLIRLKSKIAAMSPVLFDLSLPSLTAALRSGMTVVKDVRVCVQPDSDQIIQAYRLGCKQIKVCLAEKPGEKLPFAAAEAFKLAKGWNMAVTLHFTGGYPVGRKLNYLSRTVTRYNIDSVVFDAEYRALDPMVTYGTLLALQQQLSCLVEYYGRNGKGLATGNALSAIKSGVRRVAVSVGGVGGYPAFEEVLMGVFCLLKFPVSVPGDLALYCKQILSSIDQSVSPTKPIIGADIFAHESGIHVDGVNKKSDLYEPFSPETVGLSRKIVIGKHSGRAAIEIKLKEMNRSLPQTAVLQVLERVRSLAIRQKAPVSDQQLSKFIHEAAL